MTQPQAQDGAAVREDRLTAVLRRRAVGGHVPGE